MKQKTAMMELIEKWEIQMRIYFPKDLVYKALIRDAKELLEKEKEQIMDAYKDGYIDKYDGSAIKYYNETYKQDKRECFECGEELNREELFCQFCRRQDEPINKINNENTFRKVLQSLASIACN